MCYELRWDDTQLIYDLLLVYLITSIMINYEGIPTTNTSWWVGKIETTAELRFWAQ